MDMTTGPLFINMLLFSLPIMASGVLQLLFNAADVAIVGKFAENGDAALAAVGSTSSLCNLIVNLFMGLSIGAGVVVARHFGAKRHDNVYRSVHTAILMSIISGIAVMLIGFCGAEFFLKLMGSPDDVRPLATLYLRIYFLGAPFNMFYNFGAAILRAVGDSKRPLYFLAMSGIINILLNLFTVIVLQWSVAGVATATMASQVFMAVCMFISLVRSTDCYRLELKSLKIDRKELLSIIKIGLPAGLQSTVFALSNVVIQSTVNSFGKIAMAGSTAASSIEHFVYMPMHAINQATLNFIGQNVGAKKYERLKKIMVNGVILAVLIGIVLASIELIFIDSLLSLYNNNPEVMVWAKEKMYAILPTYFLCGCMEIFIAGMRGLGASITSMIISTMGACGIRILWVYTILPLNRTFFLLYCSFGVSWLITAVAMAIAYTFVKKNFLRREGVLVK